MTPVSYDTPSGVLGKARRVHARAAARRMAALAPQRGVVSFSFDDFPKSAAEHGAEILEGAGARGTFYAATCWLGGQTHHGAMYDADDLRRLAAAGHEIGAHTHSHFDCGRSAAELVVEDTERNLRALADLGFADIASFAFPYGEASPAAKRMLGERFATMRGVQPRVMEGRADLNLMPAYGLDGGEAGLQRVLAALRRAARHRAWVIVYGHDVQESPTEWGCTPAMLRRAVEAACELDLDILTVGEAARRLTPAAA